MRADDRLVLVERNEQFVTRLSERLKSDRALAPAGERIQLLHAAVEDLPDDEPYDLIISGLPLNNFEVETVERILAKLRRLLSKGGTLSFFEYVAVRRAKKLVSPRHRERLRGIERVFGKLLQAHEVHRDLVLANMPPAWVHHVRFGG
jgi:phospholipid N-methyltransferase